MLDLAQYEEYLKRLQESQSESSTKMIRLLEPLIRQIQKDKVEISKLKEEIRLQKSTIAVMNSELNALTKEDKLQGRKIRLPEQQKEQ